MPTLLPNHVGSEPATAVSSDAGRAQLSSQTLESLEETRLIESDPDLYRRVLERLEQPGRSVPAEEVFGPLDDEAEV